MLSSVHLEDRNNGGGVFPKDVPCQMYVVTVISTCVILHNICSEDGHTSIWGKESRPAVSLSQHSDIRLLERHQFTAGKAAGLS